MNRVLNATVQRTADHAAPEITLDPLEIVGGMHLSWAFILSCFYPLDVSLSVLHFPLVFHSVFQVRSDHLRTHISVRQHVSCPVCLHHSCVSNWPVGVTQPMLLTYVSLERKFMAQVGI